MVAMLCGAVGLGACGSAPEQATAPMSAPALATAEPARATTTTRPPTTAHATEDPTVVVTDKGPVKGSRSGSIRRFSSIPFATPPVGDLRWRNPTPPAPWTEVKDTTDDAPLCVQTGLNTSTPKGTEDCLYLSVHAPADPGPKAPVMVWFHGGGFTLGAPTFTDPSVLVEKFGVVVVSPSYRLGPLGFASTSELADEDPHHSSGSYGIADQKRALEWVQDNAAAFGGDPGNVTVFGESAGGWSICTQLVAPSFRGLFHKAIIQSGPCTMPLPPTGKSRAQGVELAKAVGCERKGKVDLVCFRSKSAEELLRAIPGDGVFGLNAGVQWAPTIDGWFLDRQVGDAISAGMAADIPIMIGWNKDEGQMFQVPSFLPSGQPFDATTYPQVLAAFAANDEAVARRIEEHYPLSRYENAGDAWIHLLGDSTLKCPGRRAAVDLARRGNPVFVYSFEYPDASFQLPVPETDLGAFHSAEIQFVFGTPQNPDNPSERALGSEMSIRWAQFAKTDAPTGGYIPVQWPTYDGTPTAQHLVFDRQITTGTGLDHDICEFWDSLHYSWARK